MADIYNFRAYFYWQPNLFTSRKQLSSDERTVMRVRHPGYYDLAMKVDSLMKQQMKAHEELSDLSHVFDNHSGTVFEDWAHVLPHGNKAVAEAIAKSIVLQ